jgi:hypothetical protein
MTEETGNNANLGSLYKYAVRTLRENIPSRRRQLALSILILGQASETMLRPTRSRLPIVAVLSIILIALVSVTTLFLYLASDVRLPGMQVADNNPRLNYAIGQSSDWIMGRIDQAFGDGTRYGSIEDLSPVRKGRWPGSFDTPVLPPLDAGNRSTIDSDPQAPAFLMLHIFSMPTETARRRRSFIRRHHPLLSVPDSHRHLIEVKFVLGRFERSDAEAKAKVIEAEEAAIDEEARVEGDLVRLEDLKGGENMDQGKTLAWIRWVGRDGGRQAQWVMYVQ